MALMQHTQQRARGVSGPGDEAARLPDQNVSQQRTGESQGAALMVSLEGWAASPTRRRGSAADVAMVGAGHRQPCICVLPCGLSNGGIKNTTSVAAARGVCACVHPHLQPSWRCVRSGLILVRAASQHS